jgi:hypothetical protein
MALSKNTARSYDPAVEPMFADIPVEASDECFQGAAVTDSGGTGLCDGALVASEAFLGFVERYAKDLSAVDGTIRVKIRQQGIIKDLAVTGLDANTDFGVAVYASDNGTFTLTSSATFVQIGKVQHYKGVSGFGDVFFQGAAVRSI